MKRFLGVGLLLLVTSIAAAQDQPRTRGGFGGPGGGFGGGGTSFLLQMDEVKKELKITDEQQKKLTELGEAARKELSSTFGGANREELQKLSDEERRKRFDEMRKKGEEASKKTQAEVAKVLDAKQNERLGQLALQREGINAIGRSEVAEKLGLSGDQREEIEKIMTAARPTGGGFGGSQEERQAAFEKMQKAREKAQSDLTALLTPEQKAKWESMLGAKFEFPNRGFGGRGGPGGGPGRGGNAAGGQGGNRTPATEPKK